MIHGLMMAAAIGAAAEQSDVQQPRTDSFGSAGSVVLGDVIAARALTPAPGIAIGAAGPLSAGWLSFGSTRSGEASIKSISAEPSFDVFVADGISVGALLRGGVTSIEDGPSAGNWHGELWHVTAMPRVGDTFDLTKEIAVWPRFGAGVSLYDSPGQTTLGTVVRATFEVPFVFRFSRHVMLQAGPQVSYFNNLSGPNDVRGFTGGGSGGLSIVL